MSSKVASLADLRKKETNNTKFDTVEAYGTTVRVGSVSSHDMLEWLDGNKDEAKKRVSGVRLIVKSITDENGERFPESEQDEVVKDFLNKDAIENGKVLVKVLRLNGFPVPKDLLEKTGEKPAEGAAAPADVTVADRKND